MTPDQANPALRCDAWLSERLGKPAYDVGPAPHLCRLADLPQGPSFISAKVPVNDTTGALHLQNLGFCVVDTNVQLAREAAPLPDRASKPFTVRMAATNDEVAVRTIAAESFVYDRFHRDPEIGGTIAARIKADWAGNFFSGGRGEWMVVAGEPGKPEGFLQLLRNADGAVVIDLIAVSQARRGAGLAHAMISFAAETCLGRPANMCVGTQIANIASLGLYLKMGFQIVSANYVLHLHRKRQTL